MSGIPRTTRKTFSRVRFRPNRFDARQKLMATNTSTDPADNDVGMINRRGRAIGGLGGQAAGGNERGGQSQTRSCHAASVAGPSDMYGCDAACRAAVGGGETLGLIDPRHALPVLQHLIEVETGRPQGRGRLLWQRIREGQHDRFLAFVAGAGFAGEGTSAQGGPLADLIFVGGAVAQRQQRAIERVGLQIEQPGLLDQTARLDQAAGADLAPGVLEFGFLVGEPGLLLFVRAQALSQ